MEAKRRAVPIPTQARKVGAAADRLAEELDPGKGAPICHQQKGSRVQPELKNLSNFRRGPGEGLEKASAPWQVSRCGRKGAISRSKLEGVWAVTIWE